MSTRGKVQEGDELLPQRSAEAFDEVRELDYETSWFTMQWLADILTFLMLIYIFKNTNTLFSSIKFHA